jgi:peptide/nickel transport system permease protein
MIFLARRFVHCILLLLGVSLLSFVFLQLAPGNFFDEIRLDPKISRQTVIELHKQFGMDEALPTRYLLWLKSVLAGDWGLSFAYNTPVAPLIRSRSANTLLLTGSAMLLSWAIALPAGIWFAVKRDRWIDHAGSVVVTLMLATPDLLLALGILWIAVRTHWFHAGGISSQDVTQNAEKQIKDMLLHMIGPTLVLVLGSLPVLVRHIRAAVIEAAELPFIQALKGHGVPPLRILWRHVLPAAASPLISLFGLSLGSLLSASLLVEIVMSWPGLGPLLMEAILARDLYVVIGAVMFSAFFLISGMLAADVLLLLTDPRIRTEGLA